MPRTHTNGNNTTKRQREAAALEDVMNNRSYIGSNGDFNPVNVYADRSWLWRVFNSGTVDQAYNLQQKAYDNYYNSPENQNALLQNAGYNTNMIDPTLSQSASAEVTAASQDAQSAAAAIQLGTEVISSLVSGSSAVSSMIYAGKELPSRIRNNNANSAYVEELTNQAKKYGRRKAEAEATSAEAEATCANLGITKAQFESMAYGAMLACRNTTNTEEEREAAHAAFGLFYDEAESDLQTHMDNNNQQVDNNTRQQVANDLANAIDLYAMKVKSYEGSINAEVAQNLFTQVSAQYSQKVAQYWLNDITNNGNVPYEVRQDYMKSIIDGISNSRMPEWAKTLSLAIVTNANSALGSISSSSGHIVSAAVLGKK